MAGSEQTKYVLTVPLNRAKPFGELLLDDNIPARPAGSIALVRFAPILVEPPRADGPWIFPQQRAVPCPDHDRDAQSK
jgi:hypothetical protein